MLMDPVAFFCALEEWDDFHYICLTADQLVLTQPPHMLWALCCELPDSI